MGKILAKSYLYALALFALGAIFISIGVYAATDGKTPEQQASETWRQVMYGIGIFAILLATAGYKVLLAIFEYKVLKSK